MHIGSTSRVLIGMMAGLLASQGIAQAQFDKGAPPGTPGHEIIHLKGDLYRFRQVRHYGMFLHTPEGIILVDPANSEAAKWLKAEFARRFKVPVKYVIYSHAHNDHASGGEVFADTATFVAHENMAKNLVPPADGAPLLPREVLWDKNRNGGIEQSEAPAGMAKELCQAGSRPQREAESQRDLDNPVRERRPVKPAGYRVSEISRLSNSAARRWNCTIRASTTQTTWPSCAFPSSG